MKLVVAIIQDKDAGKVVEMLVQRGYGATRINTVGGFLRRGNATILTGVDDQETPAVIGILREICSDPASAAGESRGAGVAFILPVAGSLKI
jgi:uncharacterized protein YaaQ